MKVDIFAPEAAGKYAVIYADPPWSYTQGGHLISAEVVRYME